MDRLRIGIDVRQFYRPMPRGMGKYICRLLQGLAHILPEVDFLLYHERRAPAARPPMPPNFRERRLRFRGSRFELWERLRLPMALYSDRAALFHGTANTLPRQQPCPMVATLHDTLLLEGEGGEDAHALYVRSEMPSALRHARRIITDSLASAVDIERVLGYPREHIRVIPLGVDECFDAREVASDAQVLASYGVTPGSYLFALGAQGARKNTKGLLAALARCDTRGHPLLIVGMQEEGIPTIRREVATLGLEGCILLQGYVPAAHLPALYRHALAFIFPSRREGFGLPILEALACGTPVLCGNRSSMPEIAGENAVYFDAREAWSIAAAIDEIIADEKLRRKLTATGPARAAEFSWEKTAMRTLEVYFEVLREEGHEPPALPPAALEELGGPEPILIPR